LVQPPRLSRNGGSVPPGSFLSFTTSTNVSVYYTLDGSDPRLSQGAISSSAIAYKGPIVLQTNMQIVARARNPNQRQSGGPPASTPWSGRVEAKFVIASP
jgi:Fn3 domain-containing protein